MAKQSERQISSSTAEGAEGDPFAQEIARRLNAILPAGQRSQVVAQVVSVMSQERFSGPIAHPKHLREYEEIVRGSGDRIIRMAEANLEHAQCMQDKAIEADIADMKEGRRLGFVALMVLTVGAIVCGAIGQQTIALALLGASVIGSIGTLIKGRGTTAP